MRIKRRVAASNAVAAASASKPPTMNIQKAHGLLGHVNEADTRATAKHLGWVITRGSLNACLDCSIGKARQKNLPKHDGDEPEDPSVRRMYLDLHTLKGKDGRQAQIHRPHMLMKVLAPMNLKLPTFHRAKNGMIEETCEQMHRWKQANKAVTHI